jgi:hypothetical protein
MNKLIAFFKKVLEIILDFLFPKAMLILADGDEFATADNKIFYLKEV